MGLHGTGDITVTQTMYWYFQFAFPASVEELNIHDFIFAKSRGAKNIIVQISRFLYHDLIKKIK